MIKSAHSILALTLGFWKRPFSQAQHSPLQSDATLPTKMQSGGAPCFLTVRLSTRHSWHASALFLPLYQLDGYYRCIQWWASLRLHTLRTPKLRSGREELAEIYQLHCSQITSAFAYFMSLNSFFSSLLYFFSLSLSPSAYRLNDT